MPGPSDLAGTADVVAALPRRPAAATEPLPVLRDDLRLLAAAPGADGAPRWTIFDPVRNAYFEIGHLAFELLSRWAVGDPARVLAAVRLETTLRPEPEDVIRLGRFLVDNQLVRRLDAAAPREFAARRRAARPEWWRWLVHRYLFFRIPLVRPDRFLAATAWLVAPAYRRGTWVAIGLLGVLGLFLALRRWDAFGATFLHFFTLEGILYYVAALVAVKLLHELGHAYTAHRHGCRVPTMGVAFLVLWPVLYTDTTDAWRLTDRRARLAIGAAGMLVELAVALLATLAWSFLPDGPLRSAAFFLASISWVMTLAVNLNPFMRFDGYYLLSDLLGMPNLQDRAFALARWWLRERLFGFGEAPPEPVPPGRRAALLAYAYATWIYRLVLFLGIALLVYHLFFKALGVVLFTVEIAWFIVLPVARELGAWWSRRATVGLNGRSALTLAALCGLLALLFVPWRGHVDAPAVLRAAEQTTLFTEAPGRLAQMPPAQGSRVRAGEVLARQVVPELAHRVAATRHRIDLLELKLRRRAASPEDLSNVQVLIEELAGERAVLRRLEDEAARLSVTAGIDGVLVDVEPTLRPGLWLPARLALARVVAPGGARLHAYLAERDLPRVAVDAAAEFFPEDPARPPLPARVVAIDETASRSLHEPALASDHGGPIAVRADERAGLVPEDAVYRVRLVPINGEPAPRQVQRGTVRIDARPTSIAHDVWQIVLAVFIRESGF